MGEWNLEDMLSAVTIPKARGRSTKPTAVGYAAQPPPPPSPNSSTYRVHNATYIGKGFGKYFACEDNTQRLYCGKVHCKLLVTL